MASSQRRGKSGARESEVTKDQGREVVYVISGRTYVPEKDWAWRGKDGVL